MTTQLHATMIKTSGDAQSLKPLIQTYALSPISRTSDDMISDLTDLVPDGIDSRGPDFAAMLNPQQGDDMLGQWLDAIKAGTFAQNCAYIAEELEGMQKLCREGFSMIITEG